MSERLKKLKMLNGLLPKQKIKTLRGQLLKGDIKGFDKGLKNVINRYGLDF